MHLRCGATENFCEYPGRQREQINGLHSIDTLQIDTLQRLHDRAHSIIENARIKDEWSANWLSVENLIRFDRSVMAYKILNKLSPESLWNKYQYRSAYSNYETRNCKDL